MSGSSKSVVYWDSSAFIALIKGEQLHGDGVADALKTQASAFDRGEIILATSTIGVAEVLAMNLPDGPRDQFEAMVRRSNFQLVAASETISREAARLKVHCYGKEKNGDGQPYLLSTPDAIHVVSAMRINADVLVTLDSDNKPTKVENRVMGMTKVADHYPVPDLFSVPIRRPALGLPGTGLI